MENESKMYSNEKFSENLKKLIIDKGYSLDEILKTITSTFEITYSKKQLQKYVRGTTNQKIGSDILYALAVYFDVSIDGLLGRVDLYRNYIDKDDPNFNKFHLDANSRFELSYMKNDTEIKVLNKIISKSNLIDIFATQLQNATEQIKNTNDIETKNDIAFLASHKVQAEIDKLFIKCLKEYMKK